jgi:hypothetical protein
MELLDSRCSVCKGKSFQCSECQSKDKEKKKKARQDAAAAKALPAVARLAGRPSDKSMVDMIPDAIVQMTPQEMDLILGKNSPVKATPPARRISAVALPQKRPVVSKSSQKGADVSSVVVAPVFDDNDPSPEGIVVDRSCFEDTLLRALDYVEPTPASAASAASAAAGVSSSAARPKTRKVAAVKLPDAKDVSAAAAAAAAAAAETASRNKRLRSELKAKGWVIVRILKNGHCLFESIARAFKIYRPELQLSMFQIRLALAKKMKELKGVIPNFPIQMFEENESGELFAKIKLHRDDEVETNVSLDEYCDLLCSSLYGGQEEIVLLANMYKLKLTVYDQQQSLDGSEPQTYLQNFLLPADHPDNAGNMPSG